MRAQAHAPAPFAPLLTLDGGWRIIDARGEPIALLPCATSAHPPEECEATVKLFASSPLIADVLRRLLVEVDAEVDQRKSGGNAEAWSDLDALSVEAHALLGAALIDEAGQ